MTNARCAFFGIVVSVLVAGDSFAQVKPAPLGPSDSNATPIRADVIPGPSNFAPPRRQQIAEDEVLKTVVQAETKAFYDRDFEALQAKWLHDSTTSRHVIGYGRSTYQKGWDEIAAGIAKSLKANALMQVDLSSSNFAIRKEGNIAWLDYEQGVSIPQLRVKQQSRERRLMVKTGNEWKIGSSISVLTSSYDDSPENIESRINNMGYFLLEGGKTAEAVEMFRLNVRLYPQSWNVYDSLGEAYATAGQKELAIQNYEKSISLNPKNEDGKAALAKLRGK